MDIKEIALKVASELDFSGPIAISPLPDHLYIDFATALIAEIAKQNEPICQFRPDSDNWIDCRKQFFEMWLGEKRIVYALPPTAEQIANETAEAIGQFIESQRNNIPATGIEFAEVIRSGAWKEFKKS